MDKVKELYEKYPCPNYGNNIERFNWALEITSIKKGSNILDLGCGTGELSCLLSRYGKVTGVDFSKNSIKKANELKRRMNFDNADFFVDDIFKTKIKNNFDYIFCVGVLHHIKNIDGALIKIRALMKPETILVCCVYNYYSYWRFNHNLEHPAAENDNMFQDIYNHPYAKYYTEREFMQILERNGFRVISFWKKIPNILRLITGRGK